tara:strand:- start:360 stop:530 length:171 start_codon:yes stop_codon:yes gene_type:complete
MNGGSGTIGNALKPLVFPNSSVVNMYVQGNTNVAGVPGTTLGNQFDILLQAVYEAA